MKKKKKKFNYGFTLIEIMIVLLIIGLLTSLVIYNISDEPDKAKVQIAKAQIKAFEKALENYKLDNGFYPTTEQGLEALVKKPMTEPIPKNWKAGGYLEKDKEFVPKDPWGNDYIYISPGIHRPNFVDIYSYGADGKEGGEGVNADIQNWNF
ncbi:MAG TPA: type II secretion system major pseudopilin GspG [bacterium]|nr:type II secretion system major pseudopilin GspG [bacterium]HOL47006.1 type II secretion system major pseudopilin GspG [bacterium]HPQ18998.1 type II secretion system major pseudopilin GspG [bacterium]